MSCPPKLKAFGHDLLAWLKAEAPWYAGWGSGKCHEVARALRHWIGPEAELWVVASSDHPNDYYHALVKVGSCFLDDGGAWSKNEVLRYWPSPNGILRPMTPEEETRKVCDRPSIGLLAHGFDRTFGPGKQVWEWAGKRWRKQDS